MDFDFDDGLSEDWISQPRSSNPPSVKDDSMLSQQTTNKAPQSRIPRPKSAVEFISRKKLQSSEIGQTSKAEGPSQGSVRRSSSQSLSSLPQGTVQQRHSKGHTSGGGENATPDWKKRILQNNKGRGEQTDLFSPIGLEQAFQPPKDLRPVPTPSRSRPRPKPSPPQEIPPSSPPIAPARTRYTVDPKEISRDESIETKNSVQADFEEPPVTAYKWDSDDSDDLSLPPAQIVRPIPQERADIADREGAKEQASATAVSQELHSKLQHLGIKERDRPTSPFSDSEIIHDVHGSPKEKRSLDAAHQDASATSTHMPNISDNAFITTRRGGHSMDDSFMNRSLSDPSYSRSSLPSAPTPPRADVASEIEQSEGPSTPPDSAPVLRQFRASGSPLKLFDKHDTFTHRCLNRRISQFEGKSPISSTPGTVDARKTKSSPPPRKTSTIADDASQDIRRMSNFGAGHLDSFGFDHRHPNELVASSPGTNDEDQENQPPLPRLDRNSQTRFRLEKSNRPVLRERRTDVDHTTNQTIEQSELPEENPKLNQTQALNDEGKRIPSSPQKKRESKRRRTSHVVVGHAQTALFEDRNSPVTSAQSLAGKKRKDARYENSPQAADPEVIATRHRLRPRASHSASRSTSAQDLSMSFLTDPAAPIRPVDITMEALADQLATFANGVAESVVHGQRKKSVTTADYFKEANMIMQNIRAQALSDASHNGGQAKEPGQLSSLEESFNDEYTLENFSRPASRDGNHTRNLRQPKELDPRVVSHLKKYDETNEHSDFEFPSNSQQEKSEEVSLADESDPPNLRIHERLDSSPRKESLQNRTESGQQSNGSQNSGSNRSEASGGSIPTTSSGSTRPRVILPNTISHILTDNVGRMTFDAKLQRWVRRKSSKTFDEDSNVHDSELTEDDPFKEIPDLAIDESVELRSTREKEGDARSTTGDSAGTYNSQVDEPQGQERPKSSGTSGPLDIESSAFTKVSRFASSGPAIETRATSWGDQPIPLMKQNNGIAQAILVESDRSPKEETRGSDMASKDTEDKRSNISLANKYKARSVTVTFSSPLVEPSKPRTGSNDETEVWEDESELDLAGLPDQKVDVHDFETSANTRPSTLRQGRNHSRRFSIGNKMFTPRPISRIDENDEMSLLRVTSSSNQNSQMMLTTPQPLRDVPGTLSMPPTAGRNSSIGFHLSPLPDFTITADESMNLDVDYVAKRRGLMSMHDVENKFSLAIKDLVQKITDVEPYEPYWEYIRKLELRDRRLLTLHMLDEFCSRIEELDVSDNELGQANGAPESIRVLNISNNCLSGLTAWGHLQNLQYLDVSGNNIDSLRGFSSLIHLRELNAERNKIESLDGVLSLNGLIKLNVGNNCLKQLDFEESELFRLVELHAFCNEIESVDGLESLQELEKINLRDNKLKAFQVSSTNVPRRVNTIDLSGNDLSYLDFTDAPWVKRIILDDNHILSIKGLDRMRKLTHVSWRNQTSFTSSTKSASTMHYQNCFEAHVLSLSGNKLGAFSPGTTFLNMRRLELASCGLDKLAEDFGRKMPNLRFLNLNHNGLSDLSPLLGLSALEELHVFGNRLNRLRRTTQILGKLGASLRVIDTRTNPLTIGFYSHKTQAKVPSTDLVRADESMWTPNRTEEDASAAAELSYLVAPPGDPDEEYERKLDQETIYRRQVYELLIMHNCRNLEQLDGRDTRNMKGKDRQDTLDRLIELGVVKRKGQVGKDLVHDT